MDGPNAVIGTCKKTGPFGSWPSPITAARLAEDSIALGEVRLSGDAVYWLEGRPAEGARGVVVALANGATGPVDLTPLSHDGKVNFSVGSQVYEYGGGGWIVDDGQLYFSEEKMGRLYRQPCGGGAPVALTPLEMAGRRFARHYSDGTIDAIRKRWIGVVEDWTGVVETSPDPLIRNPRHRITAVDTTGGKLDAGTTIAEGHDFYSSPRLSPNGRMLAWLAWDLPGMPWQGTTLYVVELEPNGMPSGPPVAVAGGRDDSIFQPEWSPDGTELWFVSDTTGWWNLYRYRLSNQRVEAVTAIEAEFGRPQWYLGMSTYAFTRGGRVVASYIRDGSAQLAIVDPGTGTITGIDLPFTSIGYVRSDGKDTVLFNGAAARMPFSIVSLDLTTGEWQILKSSTGLASDPAIGQHLSDAEAITFPTTGGEVAHGLYYAPANAGYEAPAGEKPPLVVMSHGGPTGQTMPSLNFAIQYWTSRGVAVLDVNYRGSTGYGRPYRDRLKESWGIIDVEDCISGARYLASKGLADGDRAVITGRSAGGYTTLAALTFHDYFRAGASHYGIGDLMTLATGTHKFESRYLDWLIGTLPEHSDRYHARSPVKHVEKLTCPVILFQGAQDEVVPPDQSTSMFEAIRDKGLPVGYLLFEGERHGFKQKENRIRAIEAEHYFFSFQVFRTKLGFAEATPAPASAVPPTTASASEPTPPHAPMAAGPATPKPDQVSRHAFSIMGMGHDHAREHDHGPGPGHGHDTPVGNDRHFHAFALLGKEQLFASHLTMLDIENHMYQLVMAVSLPEPWRSQFIKEREAHPDDSYFMANTLADSSVGNPTSDPMTVPEIASRMRTGFVGNIFRGVPYKRDYLSWPWAGVRPVLANIPLTVDRIVHFRPFSWSMAYPDKLTYLLFGAGAEAHMVNFQTKMPDYDHVLSLAARPDWIAEDSLRAGILLDLPDVPRLGPDDQPYRVRCANPIPDGTTVNVRYRGTDPVRTVRAGFTSWFCLRVGNHPDPCAHCKHHCGTETPKEYLSTN